MKILYLIITLLGSFSLGANEVVDELKSGEGYVLIALNIEAGYVPHKVTLDGDGFFSGLMFKDLGGYNNYWLVPAKAGTYTWDRIYLDGRHYLDIGDDNYSIKVEEGKINYGGHLSLYTEMNAFQSELLGGARTYFNNRSTRAFAYLSANYTELVDKYPLHYSGSYRDHFFNYLNDLEKNE